MDRSFLNFAAFLGIVIAIGYLLYLGQGILIPLVIAIIIWFLISAITEFLENKDPEEPTGIKEKWSIPDLPNWWKLPRWLAMTLAIAIIAISIQIVVSLVSGNYQSFLKDLPTYQTKLESLISTLTQVTGIQIMENIQSNIPDDF